MKKCKLMDTNRKLYRSIIKNYETYTIENFETRDKAEKKMAKIRAKWTVKVVEKERNEKGQYTAGWVVICCK